ncbi:polysaccharide deacetylase family protein [Caulobacter hibisci]|uniref:Polysaccharide deacetylase n=1 Tax=Caulobacter hibisci TaxID=2035993 RepID=A0ABS0SVU9_9CAUL|nr:polysaccharide deacetylase [Caulobacter hibisci]MBI1682813.1 polysaccharide deacetylase [Caulobacter hibisci]
MIDRFLILAMLGPELALWRRAGRRPVVWWRDDDARKPGPALSLLLALSARHAAPLTVAAIPDGDLSALVRACAAVPGVELAIHGFRHENRAPAGQPSGEVNGEDRLVDVIAALEEATAAFARAGARPSLFVPPWNNVHRTLETALAVRGLSLSGYDGAMAPEAAPPRIDAHLDLMRWKPVARFRGAHRFLSRARRLLAERRRQRAWGEPIGLLTHHLDHDEAAWRFLDLILPVLAPQARPILAGHVVSAAA